MTTGTTAATGRRVAVVGGGIAGLATAALLAAEGYEVDVFEQQDAVGGRAGSLAVDGFRFDTGPSWYLMPEVFDHFYQLLGTSADRVMDKAEYDAVKAEVRLYNPLFTRHDPNAGNFAADLNPGSLEVLEGALEELEAAGAELSTVVGTILDDAVVLLGDGDDVMKGTHDGESIFRLSERFTRHPPPNRRNSPAAPQFSRRCGNSIPPGSASFSQARSWPRRRISPPWATIEYWPCLRAFRGNFSMRYSGISLVRRNTENTALSDPMSMA